MEFEQYRKRHPATRCFQRYSAEQCANHAASHRLGHNRRKAVGEFFYTHEHAPGIAFPKRGLAERAGYDAFKSTRAAV